MPRFVVVDFETANASLASICQVGIAVFDDAVLRDSWVSLVNPEDYFDGWNVEIHGITEEMVADAPTFPDIYSKLSGFLNGNIVVSHTHFDRTALVQATERYRGNDFYERGPFDLPPVECRWLDSAKVVRRTWLEFAQRGYGLVNVCGHLGIEFRHHDALEDARAAGELILRAMGQTGMGLEELLARSTKPIFPRGHDSFDLDGDPEGPFYGEEMVFTGALKMLRREAASLAAAAGCDVAPSVRKTTTILVVGDQDLRKLAGHDKSSKHRKAEALRAEGHPIRILAESDFMKMIDLARIAIPA